MSTQFAPENNTAMKISETMYETQWGLQLPNGAIVWPPDRFHDMSTETEESRQKIVDALKVSAENMGFHKLTLLGHYKWRTRRVTIERYCGTASYVSIPLEEGDPEVSGFNDTAE